MAFPMSTLPLSGKGLLKLQPPAADIAKMDVENLPSRSEVADHVINLFFGIGKHFRDGPLAKVKTVISASLDLNEALESVDVREHCLDTAEARLRQSWVLRVARHL